jgi:ribosomal protein S27E
MAKVKSVPSLHGFKKLQCKYCKNICDRVDAKATAVTCWKCTQQLVNGEKLEIKK